ncbi:hypothetical protein J437_LFUL017316 [Ladona fulva]|uniref:Uncharacterized protein n=1 Tax=Ladona fulva TaxID=123851 RepID=A0A8K0KNL3_LADFU|nr:hypothetical protein J437_LFUL017316 [Ladona fulva]
MGNYEESLEDFKNLLESSADYLPGLKGIGETHLSLARVYLSQQLNGLARDMCEKAVFYLTKAAIQCDFACVWKLMGDSCTLLSKLPETEAHLEVHPRLVNAEENEGDFLTITKAEVLELGARVRVM